MLTSIYRNTFDKDLKKAKMRGKDSDKIAAIMELLIREEPLPPKHKNHKLKGDYVGRWECHIEPIGYLYIRKQKLRLFLKEQALTRICFRKK